VLRQAVAGCSVNCEGASDRSLSGCCCQLTSQYGGAWGPLSSSPLRAAVGIYCHHIVARLVSKPAMISRASEPAAVVSGPPSPAAMSGLPHLQDNKAFIAAHGDHVNQSAESRPSDHQRSDYMQVALTLEWVVGSAALCLRARG
jgi:hypothetical protein